MGAHACRDHSRSELLRRGIAEAGRGLPAIEPGMPLPAGTGLSRRSFLSRSAGLALAVYGASALRLPAFEEGIEAAAAAGNQNVLVSVWRLLRGARAVARRRRGARHPRRRQVPAAAGDPVIAEVLLAAALAPARVQVSADEFRYTLSRSAVRRGAAIVELVNYGEDEHDLALRRVKGTRTYRSGRVAPGEIGELEAKLAKGRFKLWCTLPGHRKKGMRATLLVR